MKSLGIAASFRDDAMTREFWSESHQWPRDSKDHVFLARAVQEIGRAMYGASWNGGQTTATGEPGSPRLVSVLVEVAQCCESSKLESAYRPIAGGDVHPIPRSWWNTERLYERFAMCQLDPKNPFGSEISGERHAWIFISRTSLERYIASQPFSPRLSDLRIHLSPYVRVMVAVARDLNITPDNQPKKEEVVVALRNAWTGSAPLSEKLIETMATLVREPESQLGRARKTDNKVRSGS